MSERINMTELEHFNTARCRRISALNKPESLFSRSRMANILVVVFCLTDSVTLYTIWNRLMTENPLMLIFIVTAFVIGLDVTMGIAGNVIKQCRQGLRPLKNSVLIVVFCILAFLGVYVCYFWLRVSMTEISFGTVGASASLIDMTGSTDTSADTAVSLTAWAASYSLALLPLVTSLASLAVTAAVSDPLNEKIADLKRIRAEVQSHIIRLNTQLTESEDTETHIRRLREREYRLYADFIDLIERTALALQLKVRALIMEKLGADNADMITDMTEDCKLKLDGYNSTHGDAGTIDGILYSAGIPTDGFICGGDAAKNSDALPVHTSANDDTPKMSA